MNITYTINKADFEKIVVHLSCCDPYFFPPLSSKVNIHDYVNKLLLNAIRWEAWDNDKLVGLVAGYLNDLNKDYAFITSVSVLNEYNLKGIASRLMSQFIALSKEMGFYRIGLEVANDNREAKNLYKKLNFIANDDECKILTMVLHLR